jgi:hypothetical protein
MLLWAGDRGDAERGVAAEPALGIEAGRRIPTPSPKRRAGRALAGLATLVEGVTKRRPASMSAPGKPTATSRSKSGAR